MRSVTRDAAKDAAEFAAAKMAYGEGAGTRRKLIESAVAYKATRIPGYSQAFELALERQDIPALVKNAKRTRKLKDVGAVTGRNIRAVARGDRNGMSTPVVILLIAGTVAHKTGYDKKFLAWSKQKTAEARIWLKAKL